MTSTVRFTALAVLLSALLAAPLPTLAQAESPGQDPAQAHAEDWSEPGKHPGQYRTFIAYFENDLFAGTDCYYTNAVKFTWLTKDIHEYSKALPKWLLPAASKAPFVKDSGTPQQGVFHNVGFSIGQDIYTPEDVRRTDLIEDDRPYAGWLYGALALHRKTRDRMDTLEGTLGMIGPAARSEQSQNTVHKYRDIPTAEGWDNQLHDEPGAMLSWVRHLRSKQWGGPSGWGADFIPHFGATAGNVLTFANVGLEIRLGQDLPADFGTALIGPGRTASSPVLSSGDDSSARHGILDDFGWHLFAGTDARAVARNVFLDGNTFRDSHSVTKRPLVADFYAGAALIYKRVKLAYTHCLRTKEYDGQTHPQVFGSLSLSITF